MISFQTAVYLAVLSLMSLNRISNAKALDGEVETDYICPPTDQNCDTVNVLNDEGYECPVCALQIGDECSSISDDRCYGDLQCLESEDQNGIFCEETYPIKRLPTLQVFHLILKFYDEIESLPEGPTQEKLINKLWDAYILYTKDLVSFEELREILYNIPMEGSKKRRSAQKKHRDHNKLPKMFKDSKTPCTSHVEYIRLLAFKETNDWSPICTSNGFYDESSRQCNNNDKCWCVSRYGIQTSRTFSKKSHRRCPDNSN